MSLLVVADRALAADGGCAVALQSSPKRLLLTIAASFYLGLRDAVVAGQRLMLRSRYDLLPRLTFVCKKWLQKLCMLCIRKQII